MRANPGSRPNAGGRNATGGATDAPRFEDARLRAAVERLRAVANGGRRVIAMQRLGSPFVSVFPVEVLSLRLSDGSELSLFVKHLGDEQSDHPEKQRRDREIRVYEELLADAGLPVVEFHGWCRDESAHRRDVFLEYVPDWDLRYQELAHWYAASRRLADMHAHFAARAERLLRCDYLLRFDADHLCAWAERALHVVATRAADAVPALTDVVRDYARVARTLERQPPTLVHNDLAPKNVLVDRGRQPARIAFVDWELAGVGCGLLDLVDLKYGLEPAADEAMVRAYRDALAGTGLVPDDERELARLLAAAELHRTLYRLAHSARWSLPVDTVRRWVSDATRLVGET